MATGEMGSAIMTTGWMSETMAGNDRVRIDVGDLHASNKPGQILLTYALGSCLGVAVHDPQAQVGGLAHIQLPTCRDTTPQAQHAEGVWSYADRALPELFQRVYALGATRGNLRIVLAGGASVADPTNFFQIGRKNYLTVKNLLWRNGYFVAAEAVGGADWRTMRLEIGSGRVEIQTSRGREML
jgi:chemotaxis protein CheD